MLKMCFCVRGLVQERGGTSHQPPVQRARLQQRATSRRATAGYCRRFPRPDTLQPHLSGTECVCEKNCYFSQQGRKAKAKEMFL